MTFQNLTDGRSPRPLGDLLAKLEADGHDVAGARMEYEALRFLLHRYYKALQDIQEGGGQREGGRAEPDVESVAWIALTEDEYWLDIENPKNLSSLRSCKLAPTLGQVRSLSPQPEPPFPEPFPPRPRQVNPADRSPLLVRCIQQLQVRTRRFT